MISQHNKKGLHNPWLLGMLGLIILVLGVNGTFIWYATHDRSTLVDREYNTKDRKTGASVISELREQKALAWKTTIKQPKPIVMGSPAGYEISVVDREGKPVSGMLEVEAYRASDESRDFTTAFREVSPGNYQGYVSFPLKGYWELRIRVRRGEDVFEAGTDRFMVATAL
ncbi:MAG: FixH family protein [Betaproteobacteria bacterium]|nr:FixH family protein [Betaproteobacteria bacterium]